MRKSHAEQDDLWDTPIGEHPPLPASPFPPAVEEFQTLLPAKAADAPVDVPNALDRLAA
jgi:hypothetical protein